MPKLAIPSILERDDVRLVVSPQMETARLRATVSGWVGA